MKKFKVIKEFPGSIKLGEIVESELNLQKDFPEFYEEVYETSLEFILKSLGEDDEDVKQLRLLTSIGGVSRRMVVFQSLVCVVKYYNNGWTPNLKDVSQSKYCIWWNNVEDSFNDWNCCNSSSDVPASLMLETVEKCKRLVENFTPLLQEYFKN